VNIDGHRCRSCGARELQPVLDLGVTPLADRMPRPEQLAEPEPRFPLEVVFCPACGLMQILETVDPELVFDHDYPYYSSFSDSLVEHSRKHVERVIAARGLGPDSLVIELASNDGYLLRHYVERGVPVLGIDPVPGVAEVAQKAGVPTMVAFFGRDVGAELAASGRRADVVHANNVLAHVADTNGFVAGIAAVLKDDGAAVFEMPYVRDLIDHCEFDTIYHEHLCYFSLTALDNLFRRHGLFLNDVLRLRIHGGSLRVTATLKEEPSAAVREMLAAEKAAGLADIGYYRDFSSRVVRLRGELLDLLKRLRGEGGVVAAYGAAAKGSTMLNYVGVGPDLVAWVADRNVHKQGRVMPGTHQPIVPPGALVERRPDYVLLLPWNLADEILAQQSAYREAGGRFILPVPQPRVV